MVNVQRVERGFRVLWQTALKLTLIYLAAWEQQPIALALLLTWFTFYTEWRHLLGTIERMIFDPRWRDAHDAQGRGLG